MVTAYTREGNGKQSRELTCGSVNFTAGCDASPARSCSIYSNTRYKLEDILEVTRPSSLIILGWSSLRRI